MAKKSNGRLLLDAVTIRPVSREDSRRVWEIRNDPRSRPYFNTTEEIPFPSHNTWFEKQYFENTINKCMVLILEGAVCGYCRFDKDEEREVYVVSIAIDPSFQGKGLGNILLRTSLQSLPSGSYAFAEVKKDNLPSRKIFEKAGFTVSSEDAEKIYFDYKR
jgi:ribosomal protein S18 acetylase RimI-like enzyme